MRRSVAYPKRTLAIWALVIAIGATAIVAYPQIKLNPTFRSMIMADDPDRADDAKAKQTFGDDELITIAVQGPRTAFDLETLAVVDMLTQRIGALEGVRRVYSLTKIENIRGEDGVLVADDLITTLPTTPDGVAKVEREAAENPLYVDNLYSRDKRVASLNIELDLSQASTEGHAAITKAIYGLIDEAKREHANVRCYVTGYPVASYIGGIYMLEDMLLFGAGAFALLGIVMFLVFRNWQAVLATFLVVMGSVSVTAGAMSVAGVAVTMPLSAVMVFMTALGMQYSTYVGFAHREATYRDRASGAPPRSFRELLSEGVGETRGAVVLSAITTAIGFGSMYANRVPDLKLMGVFLVVGLLTTSLAVMTLFPAVLALFPFEVPPKGKHHTRVQRVLDAVGRVAATRAWLMLGIAGTVFVLGIIGVANLDTDTDAMQYFKRSSEIRKSEDFVRKHMAGTTYLRATIAADKLDAFKEPDNLRKLARIQEYVATLPHVTKAVSHADHLKLLNRALRSGTAADYQLPTTKAAVEQFLLLHNKPDDFRPWIDHDYRNASVMIRMDTMSSTVQRETEEKLEAFMRAEFPAYHTNLVGTNLMTHRAFDEMATSMLRSLGVASLLIWIVMMIGLRSFKLGTLSLIPNLAPSILVYALLPVIGQPLDPPTAVTGAIALGILADDTIHAFKTFLKHRVRPGQDGVSAVQAMLSEVGKPMVLSSVVVGVGFSVMLLSRYGTLVWMGIMMFVVVTTALFWEVVCTPALLRLFGNPKRR
jgi:predicted RND superfamily exporter protein